jgi:hypothetical protein
MAQWEKEPSLLATDLIQAAGLYQTNATLSFDMEQAFNQVSHQVIVQALCAFRVPEIKVMAIQHYTLVALHVWKSMGGEQASSSPSRQGRTK